MTILFLVAVVFPSLVLMGFLYLQTHRSLDEQLIVNARRVFRELQRSIDKQVGNTKGLAQEIALSTTLRNFFFPDGVFRSDDVIRLQQHIFPMVSFIAETEGNFQDSLSIYLTDKSIPEAWPYIYHDDRLINAPWYSRLRNSEEDTRWIYPNTSGVRSRFFKRGDARRVFSFAHLMTTVFGGQHIGAAVVHLSERRVFETFENFARPSMQFFIHAGDGSLIYQSESDDRTAPLSAPELRRATEGATSADELEVAARLTRVDRDRFAYLVGKVRLLDGWMVSRIDLSAESARLSPGRWTAMSLLVFAVLLAQVVTYRFLSSMLRRLAGLTGAMNRAAEGNLDQEFDDPENDEIGQLGRDFNFMIQRIRDLFQQTVERELAQKNAQLRALQFQITPHFIYNTVDILRMRLVMDGNIEVADGLAAFGTMMRYNATQASLQVPLREEIVYVQEYMMIQRLRFEETVRLDIRVPESLQQRFILKFVLQPLVENAVQHGRRDDEGSILTVTVDGIEEAGHIVLSVRDDGVGIREATLRHVRTLLSGNSDRSEDEDKLGLVNIHGRLRLYYGPRSGLRVDSSPGGGTVVELHIPIGDAE